MTRAQPGASGAYVLTSPVFAPGWVRISYPAPLSLPLCSPTPAVSDPAGVGGGGMR